MKRMHLVEFHDLTVCPKEVRDTLTDLLQFTVRLHGTFKPIETPLRRAIRKSGARAIVDLCSGGGGPWRDLDASVPVLLTDKFPNTDAFERMNGAAAANVTYEFESVDATAVSAELSGFRTLFSSFHHFEPDQARAILADAVAQKQGIAVFEFTRRHPRAIAQMLLSPIGALLAVPFMRPFRLLRLFWTYIVPLVPLFLMLDGIVSCLRTYSTAELRTMTAEFPDYEWEIGEETGKYWPVPVTYVIGYPRREVPKAAASAERSDEGSGVRVEQIMETAVMNGEAR